LFVIVVIMKIHPSMLCLLLTLSHKGMKYIPLINIVLYRYV
jgi:hypothetical protein